MRKLITIVFCIGLFFQSFGETNHYFFQQISPIYGFTHDAITSISEDKNGFLWFGSDDGVFYYNTLEVKKIDLLRSNSTKVLYPRIFKIYKDNQNILWVCAFSGLYKYDSDLNCFVQQKLHIPTLPKNTINTVENIIQTNNNQYIISIERTCYQYIFGDTILNKLSPSSEFSKDGITVIIKDKENILFGSERGKVFIMRPGENNPTLLYRSNKERISSICRDGNKYFIGYINGGIDVINLYGDKINEYNESHKNEKHRIGNRVRKIIKRENGEIWIGAYTGLYILVNDEISHIKYESNVGLPQSSIYDIYQGINGGIWLGTWAGGISYFQDFNYLFTHVDPIAEDGSKFQNSVTSFTEDKYGNIWIGSERKGMNLFKIKLDDIEKNKTPIHSSTFDIKAVRTLLYLNTHKLIIGTFNEGLIYLDIKTQKIEYIFNDINNNTTTAFNNNELWVGGFGFNKVDIDKKEVANLFQTLKKINNSIKVIRHLYFDSAQNLWICANTGLYVKLKNSEEIKYCTTTTNGETDNTSLYTCLEDIEGRIWLGTRGKGILIYHPDNNSTIELDVNSVVNNADIYSIIKDKSDALWFSSNHGIFRYVNEYNKIDQFTENDGLSGRQFNPNAAFVCSNGKLLFGSPNGFNVINPEIIKENIKRPEVFLAKLLINNEPFSKENTISSNSYNKGLLNKLTLNYQPNINIEVISNNFVKSEKNRFKYRLINYDDNWHEVSIGKEIIFTKIPAGKYTFEAYGSNNDKLWSISPYRLEIIVKNPFWKRWYSILAYLILITAIVMTIIKYNNIKKRLKKEVINERYRNQANELISAERIKFFLNISHEIRTPLSLILSPIQMLLSKFSNDQKTKELLTIVDRNAHRLVKLTNQTLDYRLLEEGKLKPNFEVIDIIELATHNYQYFEQQINDKHINFTFTSDFKKLEIKADADMVEKIFFNLMSNAINFTPENGNIVLSIKKNILTSKSYDNVVFVGPKFIDEALELSITDTGNGIDAESIYTIFDRFASGLNNKHTGTGIGLHLCKEYATLNKGNIMVSSEKGKGSTFVLNIPLKIDTKYEKNNNKNRQIIIHNSSATNDEMDVFFDTESTDSKKRNTILIVEPNNEFRQYLKIFLNKYYNAIAAKTAKQALDILLNIQPDVIISELKFTSMDGLDFIQHIKKQEQTKFIPIIVLTAYTDPKYQLQSILKGANSYFSKPISDNLIIAEIRRLISSKTEISGQIQENKGLSLKGLSVEPETFIAIAEKIVEENFQNTNFNANVFADMLNISQSTLFRKIKKQTNLSCTEFIRDVKLKKATHLLTNSSMNIDEIALSVGFNSTSYFVRTFKKKYKTTPSEYRRGLRKPYT